MTVSVTALHRKNEKYFRNKKDRKAQPITARIPIVEIT